MAAHSRDWLRSPAWDGFWLLSGLWLWLPLLLVDSTALSLLTLGAALLLWVAHRFATAFTAYCSPSFRPLLRQQKGRFLLLPALILSAAFLFFFLPESVLPLDITRRAVLAGSVFFLYNNYHFGAQHFGVLSIYRALRGQNLSPARRRIERLYCLVVGGLVVALALIERGAEIVGDTLFIQLAAHPLVGEAKAFLLPFTVLSTAALVATESAPARRLYLASIGLQGTLGFVLDPVRFVLLWAVQHWLVSVGLAAHMAANERKAQPESTWYRLWSFLQGSSARAVGFLCFVSILVAPLFDLAMHPERIAAAGPLAAFFETVFSRPGLRSFFLASSLGTVFVHFVLDRAVFRFSDDSVRRVSGRLLFSR